MERLLGMAVGLLLVVIAWAVVGLAATLFVRAFCWAGVGCG